MPEALDLLREGRHHELWEKCCGFLDLSLEQFMRIQRRRLQEQLRLLGRCELGKKLMGGGEPWTIDEFRESVPLTTYADYAQYLLGRQEDALPEPPVAWQRTSGREEGSKDQWIPVSRRMYQELGSTLIAATILGTARRRGDVALTLPVRFLNGFAPPPYASGTWAQRMGEELIFEFMPPIEDAAKLGFEDALRAGFALGLRDGLDFAFSTSSILVALGERLGSAGALPSADWLLSHPSALLRQGKALLKARLARRRITPADVWNIKGLAAIGTDTALYKERIRQLWGRYPLEVYGRTEASIIALQAWDYGTMTFLPGINFLEFLPEAERLAMARNPSHRPRTVLLDEVQPGRSYELVITNFLGGPFVRYRLGDMVNIAALGNERLGIRLPQVGSVARAESLIDIAGFTRLTEATLQRAIEEANIPVEGWMARKEVEKEPVLHFYIEPRRGAGLDAVDLEEALHERLKLVDSDYASLEAMLGLKPLRVTLLPPGSFAMHIERHGGQNGSAARPQTPHLNPSEEELASLMELCRRH